MSPRALQRVVVRMLHDEDFVRRVYDDVRAATSDCGLDDRERAWLIAPDPRAYRVDPLRRTRALTGLLEEFAVSCAWVVRAHGRADAVDRLDRFFTSEAFHRGVQRGSSLALDFGGWLAAGPAAEAGAADHARLETAIARARRARETTPARASAPIDALERSRVAWSVGVDVLELRAGTLDAFAAALGFLRGHHAGLVEAVLDERLAIGDRVAGHGNEGVLVLGQTDDLRLEAVSDAFARVLALCAAPIAFDDFVRAAAREGADRADCVGIVEGCVGDVILDLLDPA